MRWYFKNIDFYWTFINMKLRYIQGASYFRTAFARVQFDTPGGSGSRVTRKPWGGTVGLVLAKVTRVL